MKDYEERLDNMEKCHTDNQVSLAKINKDIEYIKLQQQSISLKLDELLKKSWCEQDKIMINEHGKGLLPSPIDRRDVVLSSVMPSVVRIPEECPPPFDLDVLDQNGYPHCVGFSCATIKQEKELREKVYEVFDGSWVYKKCKEIDDIPEYQGTYLRAGMKVLQKQGCKPLNGLEESASRFKIGGYAIIDDKTLQGLKGQFS